MSEFKDFAKYGLPSQQMRDVILDVLAKIEESENVKILYCCESGSRAWGFASPDSDYDVRFIYVRPKEHYLRLDKTRDVIEWQLDDTLDVNGWDIRKALQLLHNSNPTIFEWTSSPIVYKTTPEWERISAVFGDYFVNKSVLYHYLSMAKNNRRDHLDASEVKLKKYFYVLRPILACKWILAKNSPPPTLFALLAGECLPQDLKPEVVKLLQIKTSALELGTGEPISVLNEYINQSLTMLDDVLASLPSTKKPNWSTLNSLFLSLL